MLVTHTHTADLYAAFYLLPDVLAHISVAILLTLQVAITKGIILGEGGLSHNVQ